VKRGCGAHPADLSAQGSDEKHRVKAKNGLAAACRGWFLLTASGREKRNAPLFAHRSAFPAHNSHAPVGSTPQTDALPQGAETKGGILPYRPKKHRSKVRESHFFFRYLPQ